ncbi:uncharacterized protein LOC121366482 [Gigantopelta aegis]|uniref:uncharacterized protein LOC121366482 n=1 Tax=Gigantopelta aegis TaxID=1735272 RepID=UPI001B88DBFE|nr:uncharacterized protein LOC121366482 [Gigantopelta aegis]
MHIFFITFCFVKRIKGGHASCNSVLFDATEKERIIDVNDNSPPMNSKVNSPSVNSKVNSKGNSISVNSNDNNLPVSSRGNSLPVNSNGNTSLPKKTIRTECCQSIADFRQRSDNDFVFIRFVSVLYDCEMVSTGVFQVATTLWSLSSQSAVLLFTNTPAFPTLSSIYPAFPTLSSTYPAFPTISSIYTAFPTLSPTYPTFPTLSSIYPAFHTLNSCLSTTFTLSFSSIPPPPQLIPLHLPLHQTLNCCLLNHVQSLVSRRVCSRLHHGHSLGCRRVCMQEHYIHPDSRLGGLWTLS